MSTLTYTGVVTAPSNGISLVPMTTFPPPTISGTITYPDDDTTIVSFVLVQDVNSESSSATIRVVLTPSTWFSTSTLTGITPTFIFPVLAVSVETSSGVKTTSYHTTTTVTGAEFSMITQSPTGGQDPITVSSTGTVSSSNSTTIGTSTNTSTLAASSTSPSTSNGSNVGTSAVSKSSGRSGGAVAGIVVGCVIAVLAFASLIAFCLWRNRSRRRTHRYNAKSDAHSREVNREMVVLSTGLQKPWQKQLPQPESDQTISRLANRTLDDIELFVENFYVDQSRKRIDGAGTSDMSLFNSPYLDRPPLEILQTSQSPMVLLKHCIAYYLLLKIDPAYNDSTSLLPREFVVPPQGDNKVQSRLRVRTAQSLPNIDRNEHYLAQRDRAAQAIAQQIERAFQPWTHGNAQDRAKNLKGLLIHLSELGTRLFAQSATFEWRWSGNHNLSQGQIIMLPGLDKTTDSEVVPLAAPICLVKARIGNVLNEGAI